MMKPACIWEGFFKKNDSLYSKDVGKIQLGTQNSNRQWKMGSYWTKKNSFYIWEAEKDGIESLIQMKQKNLKTNLSSMNGETDP